MNEKKYNSQGPVVSIIVPVRNGKKTIVKLLAALLAQDYPQSHTEIIIVDNGSQDKTREIVKKYPVVLENENSVKSSYAARNKGLSIAKGAIIAFTDADCIPEKNWISEGVRALIEANADMAGGSITFILSAQPSAAEYFNSLNDLRNDYYIHNKIGAVTANLFVKANLFSKIGLFPEVQSGGDTTWTGKALSNGFSLVYVPEAVVYHPTGKFVGILRRSWFRGTGIFLAFKQRSWWFIKLLYLIIRCMIPIPSKIILKSIISAKSNSEIRKKHLAICGISYLCQISVLVGLVYSIFKMIFETKSTS